VKTRVDRLLYSEAERFAFRFACDDCAHFGEATSRCSFGYPAEPRRTAITAQAASVAGATVELCKAFELG